MGVAVKLVLDTHIWLWWIMQELDRFPAHWSTLIEEADQVLISPVSCFEVALACKRGRIQLPCTTAEWIQEALEPAGIEIAPLTPAIACAATALGEIHKDPFDRIIISTAIHSHATLLSVDGHFEHYPELKGVLAEDGAGDRT